MAFLLRSFPVIAIQMAAVADCVSACCLQREFYDLESFYGAAEEVHLPFSREEQGVPSWTRQF